MNKLADIVEGGAYDAAMWILLAPKTLLRVLIRPGWIPKYIAEELGKPTEAQFNAFMAPLLFFFLVGVLPFVIVFDSMVKFSLRSNPDELFAPLLNLQWETKLLLATVFAAVPPLSVAAVSQVRRKGLIGRQELRPLFLANAYVFGTFYALMALILALAAVVLLAIDGSWHDMDVAPSIGGIWLIWAQFVVIRTQLHASAGEAAKVLALSYVVTLVIAFFVESVVLVGVIGVPESLLRIK